VGRRLPEVSAHRRRTEIAGARDASAKLAEVQRRTAHALGVPTFYNEALGSVSQVSVYDRVKGRKGDVPDETVGAAGSAAVTRIRQSSAARVPLMISPCPAS